MMHRLHRPQQHQQHQTVQTARVQTALSLTQGQLRRVGALLAGLLLLFIGSSFYRQLRAQDQPLSNCPARLAALGIDLTAARLDRGLHFATSSSSDSRSDEAMLQHNRQRHQLYEHMAGELQSQGLRLGGIITQGLVQQDLFQLLPPANGRAAHSRVKAILHPLQTPVRAVVLPLLDFEAAHQLHSTVQDGLREVSDNIWWQDPALLHVTLWHASDQTDPVPASRDAVQSEIDAVSAVVAASCPLRVVLDRIAITASGVVVACWQVLPGSGEPADVRARLAAALPHAPPPEQQVIKQQAIFHMTLARLLAPATKHATTTDTQHEEEWDLAALQQTLVETAADLSDELCGLVMQYEEAWFVEEQDLLALGLGGRYIQHHGGRFTCPTG